MFAAPLSSSANVNVTEFSSSTVTVTNASLSLVKVKDSSLSTSPKTSSRSAKTTGALSSSTGTSSIAATTSGGSFTELTVSSKVSESVRNPSLTVTEILTVPFQSCAGISVNWSPDTSVVTFSLSLSAVNVRMSPSTSSAESVNTNGMSSSVDILINAANTGALLIISI